MPRSALGSIVYSKHHCLWAVLGGQEIPSHPVHPESQVNQGLVPFHLQFLEEAAHRIASAGHAASFRLQHICTLSNH